ncbi:MAG: hypothetical protein R3309_16875, partial [Reinekea sp.]|nr:hypothetical protein [Reinekea sp.]
NTGMTLGFLIDDTFKQKCAFWNDPDVQESDVNETCERCPFTDCESRVSEPTIFTALERQKSREASLDKFMETHR